MENTESLLAKLANVPGTRFAHIEYQVPVKTASAYKHMEIVKSVSANVQIFGTLKDYTDVYMNAVKKSAGNILENDPDKVSQFEKSDNYFTHCPDAFSIVKKKTDEDMLYLFCIFNSVSETLFFIDGEPALKSKVIEYLTPSEAKKLTDDNTIVYNKKNDVLHSVHPRTIKLTNIKKLKF